ncbi:MAG: hypothetical protein EHM42_07985, partial [Planctomycetaceae bacterium]
MSVVNLTVREEPQLAPAECRALGCRPPVEHFTHYSHHSTAKTTLFFAKVYRGDLFLGAAPVARIAGHKSTDMLRPEVRRWLGPLLGFSSRRTTCLVDTSFLAFEYSSPFLCPDPVNLGQVREAVANHLQKRPGVSVVWISEPRGDTTWAKQRNYDSFTTLPMVTVELGGHATVESYLASLSKKRRRNWRSDRRLFTENGGMIEHLQSPIRDETLRQ